MYCIKCGVELADSEKICPLCGIKVYNPELEAPTDVEYPYPKFIPTNKQVSRFGLMLILSAIFAVPIIVAFICDISLNKAVTWSIYAICGIFLTYIIAVLPLWFKKPNPVIFVPIDFASIAGYLWYINFLTNGNWFLTLAMPICLGVGLLVTATVTLIRYLKRGLFYIYGGAAVFLGALTVMTEMFISLTFSKKIMLRWSFYPATTLAIIGLFLIFLGICRPVRERLKRKLFI